MLLRVTPLPNGLLLVLIDVAAVKTGVVVVLGGSCRLREPLLLGRLGDPVEAEGRGRPRWDKAAGALEDPDLSLEGLEAATASRCRALWADVLEGRPSRPRPGSTAPAAEPVIMVTSGGAPLLTRGGFPLAPR